MNVILNILPIFLVIAIGLVGARRGFFPPGFVGPANRLAYFLAVPALIFRAIATSPLGESLQWLPALVCLAALFGAWWVATAISGAIYSKDPAQGPSRASWIQCSIHGNQGFLGLAVVFYGLGQAGLGAAGLIVAVIIVGQNLLSVITLTRWGGPGEQARSPIPRLLLNPIILATLAGLALALSGLSLPTFVDRTLQILGGLGLPLALLIVGANLSEAHLGGSLGRLSITAAIKLLLLPALGLSLLWLLAVPALPAAVAVVLLSSPSATVCVIMAGQMGGDPELASAGISLSHALSVVTYTLWLLLMHPVY